VACSLTATFFDRDGGLLLPLAEYGADRGGSQHRPNLTDLVCETVACRATCSCTTRSTPGWPTVPVGVIRALRRHAVVHCRSHAQAHLVAGAVAARIALPPTIALMRGGREQRAKSSRQSCWTGRAAALPKARTTSASEMRSVRRLGPLPALPILKP
jgi:hypothetical protein